MDFAIPDVIAARYRMIRPLGAGGSAVVWEAHDVALDRMVAVKLLHGGAADAMAGADDQERLHREARALAQLAHPRITVVFDFLQTARPDGSMQPVLVTELLSGTTLDERLAHGPLPQDEARRVCAQLADALRAAHEAGIVHRDLKPGNVMLTEDGVKLFDFGIAQRGVDTESARGLAIGTPACMAPEQLTGEGAVAASDVYALGCVLYWCLTGQPPFPSADIDQVVAGHLHSAPPPLNNIPGLPAQTVKLYEECLAKDPLQRPSPETAIALLGDKPPPIRHTVVMPTYKAPEPIPTPSGITPAQIKAEKKKAAKAARAARPSRKRKKLLVGGVVVAVLAGGSAAALVLDKSPSNSQAGTTPVGLPTASDAPSTLPAAAPEATTLPPDPSAPPLSTAPGAPTANPNTDPTAYITGLDAQIQDFISQGPVIIDPKVGQALLTSLADIEVTLNEARHKGAGGTNVRMRLVRTKIEATRQKILANAKASLIGKYAATQLNNELRALSDSTLRP